MLPSVIISNKMNLLKPYTIKALLMIWICIFHNEDEDGEDNQYANFDTWITFSDIDKIIDFDILIEK